MSRAHSGGRSGTRTDRGDAGAPGAVAWLNLAAAPTFAIMALLAAIPGGAQPEMPCIAGHGTSPLSGMTIMYLLMSVFHAAPWLRLANTSRTR